MQRTVLMSVFFAWSVCVNAADWPQRACTPQRTGATPDSPRPPFVLAWARYWPEERICNYHQPIIGGGKVFVGTVEGAMHCWPLWDADEFKEQFTRKGKPFGEDLWSFKADGPIKGSAGYADGRVFFGSMDGCAYALNADDGALAWKQDVGRPGFSTSALIADGKLFLGSRRGVMYAFDLSDGAIAWQFDAGAPYFASAAYSDGKVYAPCEDMTVSAFDAKTGKRLWQSEQLHGSGFKNWYPVVKGDRVALRVMPNLIPVHRYVGYNRGDRVEGARNAYTRTYNYAFGVGEAQDEYFGGLDVWASAVPEGYKDYYEFVAKQAPRKERLARYTAKLREAYTKEPAARNLHVLDANTGKEAYVAPIVHGGMNSGAPQPPVEGPDGYWYVVSMFGSVYTVVKMSPETGEIEDKLWEWGPGPGYGTIYTVMPDGSLSKPNPDFQHLIPDEDAAFNVAGSVFLFQHGSHFINGGLDLITREPLLDRKIPMPILTHHPYPHLAYDETWNAKLPAPRIAVSGWSGGYAISGQFLVQKGHYGQAVVYGVQGDYGK